MENARAGDGIRTHDNNVGNVVLCQLSYTRLLNTAADDYFPRGGTPAIASRNSGIIDSNRTLARPKL